jgi:DNA-binding protein
MVEDNFVFIGKKPLMSYVLATLRQINEGNRTVIIKARGKSISRAVDVAEVLRHQFLPSATVDDVQITTELLTNPEGRESRVSSIEIFMSRGEGPQAPFPPPRAPRDEAQGTEPQRAEPQRGEPQQDEEWEDH